MIYNNPEKIGSRGLVINSIFRPDNIQLLQQVNLGNYGIADLINVEYKQIPYDPTIEYPARRKIVITVIECKLNDIDANAYMQAQRYVTGIKSILEDHDLSYSQIEIKTILIGSSINTNGDFVFMYNNDPHCSIYTFKYDFDGLFFKKSTQEWRLSKKDTSCNSLVSDFRDFIQESYHLSGYFKQMSKASEPQSDLPNTIKLLF